MLLKTTYDGESFTHRLLWEIVERNAELAYKEEAGSFFPVAVSEVFAFHAVEAYINFIGERIAPDIWSDERNFFQKAPYRGWVGKLNKVLELVDLTFSPTDRPLSTVLTLRAIRDTIAHGKTERMETEIIHSADTEPPILVPSIRTLIAKREDLPGILADVEQFLDAIHTKAAPIAANIWAGKDQAIWFGTRALRGPGSWFGRMTTLHENSTN